MFHGEELDAVLIYTNGGHRQDRWGRSEFRQNRRDSSLSLEYGQNSACRATPERSF